MRVPRLKQGGFSLHAVLAVAFVLTAIPSGRGIAAKYESRHYSVDYEGLTKEEVLEFSKRADKAYEIVKNFVGDLPKHEFIRVERIHMVIRPHFRIPRTLISLWRGRNRMEMPVHRVRDGRAPLIHETTHSLAPSRNRFLAEGLAVYLEEKFGTLNAFPTFGRPLRELLCNSVKERNFVPLQKLFAETIDHHAIFSRAMVGTWTMRLAYLEGGALVKLLLEDEKFGENPDIRKTAFFSLFNGKDRLEHLYKINPDQLDSYMIRLNCADTSRQGVRRRIEAPPKR